MMMRILYHIVYSLFYLVSLLPFRILYALSDFFYLIIYRLIGYRIRIVRRNITTSFPEKTQAECREIEHGFYHFLCDYFVETIKMLSISRESMLRHIEFRNVEQLEECFDNGQTCAAILGHYCNWEYLSATGLAFRRHTDAIMGLIYHPLRNDIFDWLFIDMRQSLGGTCIKKKDILRYLVTYRRENRMSLFGYISDQAPMYQNIHLWMDFLHHDTPVFTGAERIIRKMNNAVFYVEMERPSRGHYICTFRLMTKEPAKCEEFEITRRFFAMLEQTIRRDPRYYLWSHDRWKRTHEEFDRRYIVVDGKLVPREHAAEQGGHDAENEQAR